MKQPWAWMGWLLAVLLVLSITRNPLYLVLILVCVFFVARSLRQVGAQLPGALSLWKLVGWIILLSTLFNALTSHYGGMVLFTIPGGLPMLSGNVTMESMVYGMVNGLVLAAMLASFTVLNLALPVRDLINLIPRAFFPMAVVASIAVTYLPTTLRQLKQIREAQLVRGHQMRTVRDWLPLLIPLLVGGLEHAMQLAEAMTSRGFASSQPGIQRQPGYPRLFMLSGVLLLASGWVGQLAGARLGGFALIIVGAVFVLGGLWRLGKESPRTSLHRQPWGWKDWLALGVSLVILLACLLPVAWLNNQTLDYEPYPILSSPPFSPLIGLLLLGFAIPGLLTLKINVHIIPHQDGVKEVDNA
jgi:energy-coupling factor transport system permease protein